MRMTLFADYSLRVLLYLAAHEEKLCSIQEVAEAYKISRNHLMKVVQHLGQLGVVETIRGRDGGIRLAKPADQLNVGWVVRRTEPDFELVECFNKKTNTCCIAPACKLKGVLAEAQMMFLKHLDAYTVKDMLPNKNEIAEMFASPEEIKAELAKGKKGFSLPVRK